ncbi:MAG: HAMP domain-containing protein [Candidatus Omnitrophica bacterium]|nr:HAMP domain-containing protein [Candidatus Omnitrophota bacterium]
MKLASLHNKILFSMVSLLLLLGFFIWLVTQTFLLSLKTSVFQSLHSLHLLMLTTTLGFALLGIFLAFYLSGLITKPLSQLVQGIEAIKKGDFSGRIDIRTEDEIGVLAGAFNEMSDRLNLLISEVTALAKFREREKIALDFHDGCAQDLVSLLKRIELCEKLVEARSPEALVELGLLRDYTKNILTSTRNMICDLKSKEDFEVPLVEKISGFLKDYERINGCKVAFNASGPVTALSSDQNEHLFYIITEALSNIRKHSRAQKVTVNIKSSLQHLEVTVKDNGKGFDVAAENADDPHRRKFGLMAMRHRAQAIGARLNIQSTIGRGSEVGLELGVK